MLVQLLIWQLQSEFASLAQPKLASVNGKGSESYNDWAKAELF
jgi:hypothetical protein